MSFESGTRYTAEELRKLVFKGFRPAIGSVVVRNFEMFVSSKQEAIDGWTAWVLLEDKEAWVLCPRCAARATKMMTKRWWQFWKRQPRD
jgi:hypothetical protein